MNQQRVVARLASILALCSFVQPAYANEPNFVDSGNYMLPFCRALANGSEDPGKAKEWQQGECAGIIESLLAVGPELPEARRFCRPVDVTSGLSRTIVVDFLVRHPEKLHIDFKSLVLEAFRKAWPCPRN